MIVQELFTKWGFEIDGEPLKKLEMGIDSLTSKINIVGGSAVAAATAMFGFAKFTADAGDHILHTSEMLGVNIEQLQRLQFAAKLANVSNEEFSNSLRFLGKNLIEAKKGTGDAIEAFRKLKLNPRQFATSDEALRAISDRFHAMPEGPERAALAMQLFGRSGANMVPFLKEGSKAIDEAAAKADKYGIVLTKAQAEAGDKFNDTLEETHAALTGIRNIVGNALIPQMTLLLEAFNDMVASNRQIIASKIQSVFTVLSRIIKIVAQAAAGALEIFSNIAGVFGGMTGIVDGLNAALDFILANPQFIKILGAVAIGAYAAAAAFAAFDAAALAIPLTIAAIIGIIALLVDDFVAFSQGRDSAFGLLVNFLKTEFPNAFKVLQSVFEGIIALFKIMFNNISIFLNVLMQIGKYVGGFLVSAFEKLGSAIAFISEKLGLTKLITGLASGVSDTLKATAETSGNAANEYGLLGGVGGTPESKPAAGSSGGNAVQQQNQVSVQINVPPGSDATAIGGATQKGVEAGLDVHLRKAQRTVKSGVKY